MKNKSAYEKLKKSKVEALANNSNIVVGRMELNKALKALENMEKLEEIIKEIKNEQSECDKYNTDEMIGQSYAYDKILKLLEPLLNYSHLKM